METTGRPGLDRLERALGAAPIAAEVAALPQAGGSRPWIVVRPSDAPVRARRIVNVLETVRFELETIALGFPEDERPRGWTIARSPLPRTEAGEIDRAALAAALGAVPARFWPATPPDGTPLPAAWAEWFGRVPGVAGRPLSRGTALEFDLGLDSLDRLALLLAIGDAADHDVTDDEQVRIGTLGDLVDLLGDAPARPPAAPDPSRIFRGPARPLATKPRLLWPVALLLRLLVRYKARRDLALETRGLERVDWKQRPLIVAQNHLSHIDPVLLAAVYPMAVFRRSFFLGFTGYFAAGAGAAMARVCRIQPLSADAGALTGLRAAAAAVRAGRVLGIYPEGERAWEGRLRPFRRGVAFIARETGARVVPSAISGTYETWRRGGSFAPHPVRIAFGAPIDPPAPGPDAERAFLTRLHGAMAELLREIGDPRA